jgi:hypothetical protein
MRLMLLLLPVVALASCTKKSEEPPANSTDQRQQALDPGCPGFGQTLRSLAFRRAAAEVRRTVSEQCLPEWQRRMDALAATFWVKVDCNAADTRPLLVLYNATPESARADPESFPAAAELGGERSQTLGAFHEAAAPVVATASEDILSLLEQQSDGGCARSR